MLDVLTVLIVFCVQVFDRIGDEGRPIGVVEPNLTLRVEDMLGDFLQIRFQGILGWIRYKGSVKIAGNPVPTKPLKILLPAFEHIPHFWDTLKTFSKPQFYRFNDVLPESTEIKVRTLPDFTSGAVLGEIVHNQVIECMAEFDNWLECRFENVDTVWVQKKNSCNDALLLKLPDHVQRALRNLKMQRKLKALASMKPTAPYYDPSPFFMTEADMLKDYHVHVWSLLGEEDAKKLGKNKKLPPPPVAEVLEAVPEDNELYFE